MSYTQEKRLIQIDTPLGKDVLLLQSVIGTEALSKLYSFSVDLLSENPAIKFEQIVGQKVSVSITEEGEAKRYISGVVSRFSQTGSDTRFTHYHAEVVPWLWFLTRSAASRIFQNMTVPDIVTKVFTGLGFQESKDFRKSLQGSYDPWVYCVQYRETAFNFVSRLLEQEGIFYFFEHDKDKHVLVLADSTGAHKPCPNQAKARLDYTPGGVLNEDVIQSWQLEQEFRTGKYSLKDYNFETPSTDLGTTVPTVVNLNGNNKYEIYDYPGEYEQKGQGDKAAKIRMQEEEATYLVANGSSDCRGFTVGYRFDLEGHDRPDMNKTYVLTQLHHSASVANHYYDEASGEPDQYSNSFSCVPLSVPFRPVRITPKPFVQGPQTAMVVGKKDEEIWVDKYGRVKVQFYWDRDGKKDENSSCWVRVSQVWAGKNWGSLFTPRIGQEVIVDFLEGDPDQPIITGRVYNAEQMPLFPLPDHHNSSGFISRSTKQGGTENYNAIGFNDTSGEELLGFHAEKDKNEGVEHDSREWVGNNRHLLIDANQLEKVGADRSEHIVGNHLEKIDKVHNLHIVADSKQKIDGSLSLQVALNLFEKSSVFAHEASRSISLKAGAELVIEAPNITIKAGGSFISLGPAGIAISGAPLVNINSGGAALQGTPSSPQDPQDPQDPDVQSKSI